MCRRWLAIAAGLIGIAYLGSAHDRTASTATAAAPVAQQSARLVIDFGDGVEWHYVRLPWKTGMTGVDLLLAAQAHRRSLPVELRGSGPRTLVLKIGDQANEGGGSVARNWLYWVVKPEGKPVRGSVGAGAHQPQPGETILWKFAALDTNEE